MTAASPTQLHLTATQLGSAAQALQSRAQQHRTVTDDLSGCRQQLAQGWISPAAGELDGELEQLAAEVRGAVDPLSRASTVLDELANHAQNLAAQLATAQQSTGALERSLQQATWASEPDPATVERLRSQLGSARRNGELIQDAWLQSCHQSRMRLLPVIEALQRARAGVPRIALPRTPQFEGVPRLEFGSPASGLLDRIRDAWNLVWAERDRWLRPPVSLPLPPQIPVPGWMSSLHLIESLSNDRRGSTAVPDVANQGFAALSARAAALVRTSFGAGQVLGRGAAAVGDALSVSATAARQWASNVWGVGTTAVGAAWSGAVGVVAEAWTWSTNSASAAWNWTTSATVSVGGFVSQTAQSVWRFGRDAATATWDWMSSTAVDVWHFAHTLAVTMIDAAVRMRDAVVDRLRETWDQAVELLRWGASVAGSVVLAVEQAYHLWMWAHHPLLGIVDGDLRGPVLAWLRDLAADRHVPPNAFEDPALVPLFELLGADAPADPSAVADAVSQLGADQLLGLVAHLEAAGTSDASAMLAVLGSLDGLPSSVRHAANMTLLDAEIARLQARGGDVEQLEFLRSTRELIERSQQVPEVPLSLLLFQPSEGLISVSVGDIDRADHICTMVRGTDTTMHSIDEYIANAQSIRYQTGVLDSLRASQDGTPRNEVAIVVWLGYPAPSNLAVASSPVRAEAGAAALDRFQWGVAANNPDATLTVLAHSYGTTVTGTASIGSEHPDSFQADNFIAVGSPGVRVDSADQLSLREGGTFYTITDVSSSWGPIHSDMIHNVSDTALTHDLGPSPEGEWFGAIRLDGDDAGGHGLDDYLTPDGVAAISIAAVIIGADDAIVTR